MHCAWLEWPIAEAYVTVCEDFTSLVYEIRIVTYDVFSFFSLPTQQ